MMIREALQKIPFSPRKKDELPNVILLSIFLLISYLLFPHESSTPAVKGISISNLPQPTPTTAISPTPTIFLKTPSSTLLPKRIPVSVPPVQLTPFPTSQPFNNTLQTVDTPSAPSVIITHQPPPDPSITAIPTQSQNDKQVVAQDKTNQNISSTPQSNKRETLVGTVIQKLGAVVLQN